MNALNQFVCCLLFTAVLALSSDVRGAEEPVKVPETFKVKFETSKGNFVIEVTRKWAPLGADQFHKAITAGFYNDCRFFRAINGFMVQFGINGDPEVQKKWVNAKIKDDPVVESNKRGYVSFATSGPNSRTTQMFINFGDNARLDEYGFAPFGKVVEGMKVVDSLYDGYGEGAPQGNGPSQGRIQREGNVYLKKDFPKLDYIKKATIVKPTK
ncbi:MAG: peptidylprolyl isomerase [Planctomycetaceae bacterium]|jgi:peptidyl-prolyl cis-trans isomerase A (cyclophilin A)|nr:peptidylprolyl isomerase [Planctomycetaceae bacterium]MBT6156420.1 peptidylprolyl isomerase [Planctomycetaceae bacterium]MBT6487966.1 peptidylprolyl isomerase [Planctomycetaceae bacterium]MBT6495037.1 peptidylprolyl isomerase [Planctomycetaceae bacterium]